MVLPPDFPENKDLKTATPLCQDLSPGNTIVAFDPILRLLRIPVPAGIDDDPSAGPYLLAFKDEASWSRAWQSCKKNVAMQCETGARMGCSISAVNACRGPWWENFWPWMKRGSKKAEEREKCEQREMMACLAASREECLQFARTTCDPVFANIRIAESSHLIDPRFTQSSERIRVERSVLHGRLSNTSTATQISSIALLNGASKVSDKESPSVRKHTTHYGSKILGNIHTGKSWEGPVWNDGAKMHKSLSEMEPAPMGWEGGLVWPKFVSAKPNRDGNSKKEDDHKSALTTIGEFWKPFLLELENRFSRKEL